MKTFKITVEEHISQSFDVEANNIDEAMEIAQKDYNNGFLIVESAEVNAKLIMAENEETNEATEWVEF